MKERDNPSQSASAVFRVNVLDINDNTPIYDQPSYTAAIEPGVGTRPVVRVSTDIRFSSGLKEQNN